jgi:hypothetical protein
MEVGQGPNWGCSAKEIKICTSRRLCGLLIFTLELLKKNYTYTVYSNVFDFLTWTIIIIYNPGLALLLRIWRSNHTSPCRADKRDVTIPWCGGGALYFGNTWCHGDDRASEVMTPLQLSMSKHRRRINKHCSQSKYKEQCLFLRSRKILYLWFPSQNNRQWEFLSVEFRWNSRRNESKYNLRLKPGSSLCAVI